MKLTITHDEHTTIAAGTYLPVPTDQTNSFGEVILYTNLSVLVVEVISQKVSSNYLGSSTMETLVEARVFNYGDPSGS